jgi:hypothetical protein
MLLGALTLLACSAASADELGARMAGDFRTPGAALYVQFPIAARRHEGPTFGLRMERAPARAFGGFRTTADPRTATLLDVPFNKRDPETHALNVIGPGMIVGIVVGALVVVSAVSDDDDGDGGGY